MDDEETDLVRNKNADVSEVFVASMIVMISINLLNLGNRRLRRRNAKAFNKLVRSIKHFGIARPILIDRHNKMIDGYGIVEAAIELGIEQVPAIVIDHLPPEDIKALGIALNKIQELGEWNEDVLRQELEFILELDAKYDLEVTGLELGEIEFHLSDTDQDGDAEQPDPSDTVPLAMSDPDYAPVSRLGDLFLLQGKDFEHRVYCGDARSKKAIAEALGELVATMVLTDPPFNVRIQGHVGGLGKTAHREFVMASGEMKPDEFYKFLRSSLKRMKQALKDGGLLYIYMDKNGLELLLKAGRKIGLKMHSICIWKKPNGGMSSLYRSQHEFIVIFKKGKASHVNNILLGKYGRYRTTVWEYPGFNSFSRERRELFHLHPTLKNVQMLADAIRDVTKRGDVVLDSFAGAGSTTIASEKTSRQSVSVELDPIYIDTILKRFENEFGTEALHAETGMTFSELADARLTAVDAEAAGSSVPDAGDASPKPTGRIRSRKQ